MYLSEIGVNLEYICCFQVSRKLCRKSFTGVGQQVEHPHSPQHHYTVHTGSRLLNFCFMRIRLETCYLDTCMSTFFFCRDSPQNRQFFFVGIRLKTIIPMLHRCVFGPNPFQRTTARFALIMCSSFRLGCPSEYRTLISATKLIVNCWATVRMCTPWGVVWWSMYSGSSLRDPQHGGLNESLHTGRTRHFFLQVWCGARVAHGQVRRAKSGFRGGVLVTTTAVCTSFVFRVWMCQIIFVNCRLTVCLYRFMPCRQTSWKTCASSHVDVFHKQI